MTISLVRHAQPVAPGDPRYEENDRPLSVEGLMTAFSSARPGRLARS
jgi:hypothetical protein